ncbi:MAG TPA: hypothetical protein VM008_11440 [Phycisphaerae bacterium]|nr:hypothetical protein [Phycisphaerae bacterium]
MTMNDGTPLSSIPGWSPEIVRKLNSRWISTAEQVVGVAASQAGLESLAKDLGLSTRQTRGLVDNARAALPPSVANELGKEVDTSQYGLGSLPPEDPS